MSNPRFQQILEKAKSNNVPEGHCSHCRKVIEGGKKNQAYHSTCHFDAMKYGIKAKFKNHLHMYIYLGTGYRKGQGKRTGHMVKGAMSVAEDMWSKPVPVTLINVQKSLRIHSQKIYLCNGGWLTAEEALIYAAEIEKEVKNEI